MAFLLSFLFALLETCIVDFDGQCSARLREIHQGNVNASILRVFKSLSLWNMVILSEVSMVEEVVVEMTTMVHPFIRLANDLLECSFYFML